VRGGFSARPPHPILRVAAIELPSPRKRGEGAITRIARVLISPFHTAHLVRHFTQPFSFPRRVFCARVLKLSLRSPNRGVAERRESSGACEAPVGLHVTRQARRLRGALRPITRDARLSALTPWRFWAPVPRFPHRTCVRIGASSSRPGRSARLAAFRTSRGSGCEPLPQDATPRSAFRIVSGDAPR